MISPGLMRRSGAARLRVTLWTARFSRQFVPGWQSPRLTRRLLARRRRGAGWHLASTAYQSTSHSIHLKYISCLELASIYSEPLIHIHPFFNSRVFALYTDLYNVFNLRS